MGAYDLAMYRGDTPAFRMTLTEGGTPVDISTGTLRFTAKRRAKDPDVEAVIALSSTGGDIAVENGPGGVCVVTIPADATAAITTEQRLVWDLQHVATDGTIRTWPAPQLAGASLGTLVVRLDVTRTS